MSVIEPSIYNFVTKSLSHSEVTILPLAGDASNRRYYRVVHDQASWVLMCWDPFEPENYPFLSVLNHFKRNQVHVPEVIAQSPADGLVLLEDLGDLTLERKYWESQDTEDRMIFYRMALDEIIKIHTQSTMDRTPCTAFNVEFNVEKLLWEMNYGLDNLIFGVLKTQLNPAQKQTIQNIFTHICEILHKQPKVICHRDYHSRNLMIKLNKMCVIDFQDARMGSIQYDLVSLFKDSYVDMSDEMADQLTKYYLDKTHGQLSFQYSSDEFKHIYEVQSVQRCFKACGSFASFFHQKGDRRYLKYLTPTLKRVMKSLSHFPEYKVFSDLLLQSGALEVNFEKL